MGVGDNSANDTEGRAAEKLGGQSGREFFIVVLLAIIGSEMIFARLGFDYNMFSDPFNLSSLLFDLGIYALLCLVVTRLYRLLSIAWRAFINWFY
ncbi:MULTISPECIES: hypothetical protein [Microbulbifer]|uniref:hypothetical protein n=1 Tax=Microbulbifer TaxID=48073 RepID=UPI001E2AFE67|nr:MULTISPECIES: hypothetical protein [Microbulbifer]UHQ54239.1 hypothetical protein LVE68_12005 [Microbulbifer sp. YPW16]